LRSSLGRVELRLKHPADSPKGSKGAAEPFQVHRPFSPLELQHPHGLVHAVAAEGVSNGRARRAQPQVIG
jgi:hypothetical protein